MSPSDTRPPTTSGRHSGGGAGGDVEEEEGEIVEHPPSPPRPSVSFPPKRTSTSTSSSSSAAGRPKVSLGFAQTLAGHLSGRRPAQQRKTSSSNPLKSVGGSIPSSASPALSILGQAKPGQGTTQTGAGGSAAEGSDKPKEDKVETRTNNSLGISIAGSSSAQQVSPVFASTPTVPILELPKEEDGDPIPFRKRASRGSRSPHKRVPSGSNHQPPPAFQEPTEEDKEALELLKSELAMDPSSQAQFSQLPNSFPSSSTSSTLPLPTQHPHSTKSTTRDLYSASPPKRHSPLLPPKPTLFDSNYPEAGGGLPYDGAAEFEREQGEVRGDGRGGRNGRDYPREVDDRYAPREEKARYERKDRGQNGDGRRRDDDHRRGENGKGRDESRYAHDDRRRRGGEDQDDARSRSSEQGRHRHQDQHTYNDRHSRSHPQHHQDRRNERDLGYEGRDSTSSRPSKRQRRSSEQPELEEDRTRDRLVSRSPLTADEDDELVRARSRPPPRRSVMSSREKEERERELEQKNRSKQSWGSKEAEDGRRNNPSNDRNGFDRRDHHHPPPTLPPLNAALPPRPNVAIGGSAPAPPPPVRQFQEPSSFSNGFESAGPYRSKMGPSTLDRPSPQSHSQALPRPPPSLNENGSRPPPAPPLPPAPAPPRPSYGPAASRPEDFNASRQQAALDSLPSSQPPPPPTTANDEYQVPPPAPYHAGNRPADPKDVKFESPSATKGQNTPTTTEIADVPTDSDSEDVYRGVRTLRGMEDVWVEPGVEVTSMEIDGEIKAEERGEHRFFGASHIDEYTLQQKLGEGTFGVVYKGIRGKEGVVVTAEEREEENKMWKRGLRVRKGDVVALKQIIFHNEGDGLPITSVREIRILKQLDHPNVVPVVDMALDPGDPAKFEVGRTFMVFPYMDHDLAGLLENPQVKLDIGEIKQYGKQLLEGTAYLHRNGILHRDMKAANLLINNKGVLMIADFGLARSMEPPEIGRDYTSCVVTRWYRPPELLLGERKYHYPVDMWGVGCILLEMFKRSPIFPGQSDLHQAQLIFAACGPPTDESMPGWNSLPGVEGIDKNQQQWKQGGRSIRADAAHYDTEIFADLIDKILVLDPKRRFTANDALDHDWFWSEPFPTEPHRMREFMSSHEYDRRKLKENQHAAFGQVVPPPQQQQQQPHQMVQPRPQPMPPMFNGPPQHPPGIPYPPVGAYNAPPPPPIGMQPSFNNNGAGGVYGGGNYGQPPQPQQGYGGYVSNRPPPSMMQGQPQYGGGGAGGPPVALDYGRGNQQSQYPTSAGPSWASGRGGPGPSVASGQPKKVSLFAKLKK